MPPEFDRVVSEGPRQPSPSFSGGGRESGRQSGKGRKLCETVRVRALLLLRKLALPLPRSDNDTNAAVAADLGRTDGQQSNKIGNINIFPSASRALNAHIRFGDICHYDRALKL